MEERSIAMLYLRVGSRGQPSGTITWMECLLVDR
jgi:hypothetical protein